jgi:serine/threonine-protein kinase
MTVGTVAYASPEQLMGEELDGRSDQYALAATAYHVLTCTTLFPHSMPAVVISRHLNIAPPMVSATRPELKDLDPVLAAALNKNPDGRYARCQDSPAHSPNPLARPSPPSANRQAAVQHPRRADDRVCDIHRSATGEWIAAVIHGWCLEGVKRGWTEQLLLGENCWGGFSG